MPLYDLKCANCGAEHKDVLVKGWQHHYSPACSRCKKVGSLQRVPRAAAFTVKGFNAANGYSKEEEK